MDFQNKKMNFRQLRPMKRNCSLLFSIKGKNLIMEAEDSFTFGDVRYVAYFSSCELLVPEILLSFLKLYSERGFIYLIIFFFFFGGLQCSVHFLDHSFAYV